MHTLLSLHTLPPLDPTLPHELWIEELAKIAKEAKETKNATRKITTEFTQKHI